MLIIFLAKEGQTTLPLRLALCSVSHQRPNPVPTQLRDLGLHPGISSNDRHTLKIHPGRSGLRDSARTKRRPRDAVNTKRTIGMPVTGWPTARCRERPTPPDAETSVTYGCTVLTTVNRLSYVCACTHRCRISHSWRLAQISVCVWPRSTIPKQSQVGF